jgi:hypothetical protein
MSDHRQSNPLPRGNPENRIPEETIRNRAHEIYRDRGGASGHDVEDWLQAERELREHDE